jgi:uncharacterized protein (TIGR03437 family)
MRVSCVALLTASIGFGQTASRTNLPARQRQQEFYGLRSFPGNSVPAGARGAALAEMDRMRAAEGAKRGRAPAPASWTFIGPRASNGLALFYLNNGLPHSSGRVTAVAADRRNPDVVYAGAAGGGVWKTIDGGANWQPLTDDQPSLAIGSIALAPSNPDIVYVGTGEENNSGDSYYGAGVLKSTDGGATWTQLTGPFVGPYNSSRLQGGAHIGALAVHPTDPNVVLAAVDRSGGAGIYRTSDGGVTWKQTLSATTGTAVMFNPNDPTIAYAALGNTFGSISNGVYKSSDGGSTWTPSNGPGAAATTLPAATGLMGRIELAMAPSSPNTLFVGIENAINSSLLGMYKSTDGGGTWSRLAAPDYCTPQCDYNNVIRVHPTNPNIVVAAGLPPYRSLDGGITWTNIVTGPDGLGVHYDHHGLSFSADGGRLYLGNDGGVFSTNTLTTPQPLWANLNTTLGITEFSSNLSVHPSDPRITYAGTQDNGTLRYRGDLTWDQVAPGDGGSTALDSAVPSIWYGSQQGPSIYKQTGVNAFFDIFNNYSSLVYPYLANGFQSGDRFLAYPPLVVDPSNPQRLYFPSQRLYQTNDGAGTWAAISGDLTGSSSAAISAIAVSPANAQMVAVGTTNGRVQVSTGVLAGSATFTNRSTGLPGHSISQLRFDPIAPATLYAGISGFSGFSPTDAGHVFKSTDSGQTWTNISGNLPNVPVNDVVVDPDVADTLYVATDIGVFSTSDGGQAWATLSTGLPRVLVQSLSLHRASRTLRAATYGRSMWDLSVPLSSPSLAPHVDAYAAGTFTVTGSNFVSSSTVRWNGVDRGTTFVSATTLRVAIPDSDLNAGRATLAVFNPTVGGGLSNTLNVALGGPPDVSASGLTIAAVPGGALVPGSIASVYGRNLAPVLAQASTGSTTILPYTLGGVVVEFDGVPAPIFFVSPTQVNFQVPWDLQGHSRATFTLYNGTQASAPLTVNIAFTAPAIFTTSGAATGQGAVLISGDAVLAAPKGAFPNSRAVKRGEYVEIYCTGLGPVSNLQTNGSPKPISRPADTSTPVVTIGGVPATVLFSGLTPGAVGLYQVNVQIPANAPVGAAVAVAMTLTGVASNTVTIAVE